VMVEAGTGTGKGLAYLVPAAIFAAQRGERVVISTNTINLQDQLFFKDIPALQKIMAGEEGQGMGNGAKVAKTKFQSLISSPQPPFTAALLKGRSNYLCLRRYKDLRRDGRLVSEEIKTLLKVQLWLPTTSSGDKAELLLMDKENMAWERINATLETCTGPRCADYRDCYLYKARREAEAAHLVIVNHALLLANLDQEVTVFPPYDHVIIDEAHNLEDVATDQFGFEVDQTELLKFLDDLFMTGGASTSAGLFAELPKHFRESAASQGDMDKATAIAAAAGTAVTRGRQSVYDCFNLLTSFMNQEAEARGVPVVQFRPGDAFSTGAATLTVLGPDREFHGTDSDPNNDSLVIMADLAGTRVLLTGDIEIEAQQALLNAGVDLDADVLKVPHHGSSKLLDRFVRAVSPTVAVIGVGVGNDYGHPSPRALDLLALDDVRSVLRTDQEGDVSVGLVDGALTEATRGPTAAKR